MKELLNDAVFICLFFISLLCSAEFCYHGVRSRYNDKTICCQNHTFACGRNPANDNSRKTPPLGRRKRVVGGMDVTDPKMWPWNVSFHLHMIEESTMSDILNAGSHR